MPHNSLAASLQATGFGATIAVKTLNPNTYLYGSVNPSVPFDGVTPSQFFDRYGIALIDSKGSLVGERFSADLLNELFRHPTNPLNLSSSFDPYSLVTRCDATYAKGVVGNTAAWDTYILPMHRALFPVVDPPVDPPPPPPPPPVDPPEPPVVDAPPALPFPSIRKLDRQVQLFTRMGPLKFAALENVLDWFEQYQEWLDRQEF